MRNVVVVGFVVMMLASFASAQATPKIEVFAGYSLLHNGSSIIRNLNGWNAAATTYLKPWLGITADFAGSYGSVSRAGFSGLEPVTLTNDEHLHSFLFGPHFAYRKSRYTLFTHALLGLTHDHVSTSHFPPPPPGSVFNFTELTSNSVTTAVGGGLDVRLTNRIALRPVQADYVYRRSDVLGQSNNGFRYSGGLVFRFGEK